MTPVWRRQGGQAAGWNGRTKEAGQMGCGQDLGNLEFPVQISKRLLEATRNSGVWKGTPELAILLVEGDHLGTGPGVFRLGSTAGNGSRPQLWWALASPVWRILCIAPMGHPLLVASPAFSFPQPQLQIGECGLAYLRASRKDRGSWACSGSQASRSARSCVCPQGALFLILTEAPAGLWL